MSDHSARLSDAENALQNALQEDCPRPQDIDIVITYERSLRGPDGIVGRVPVEIPFPEGYQVTFESTTGDGGAYRVWKPKRAN